MSKSPRAHLFLTPRQIGRAGKGDLEGASDHFFVNVDADLFRNFHLCKLEITQQLQRK